MVEESAKNFRLTVYKATLRVLLNIAYSNLVTNIELTKCNLFLSY